MFIKYIKPRMERLLERAFLLNTFTYLYDRPVVGVDDPNQEDIFFLKKDMTPATARYGYYVGETLVEIPVSKHNTGAPFSIYNHIKIKNGDIANYTSESEIDTTIGRFISNYIVVVSIVGDKIPYHNDIWDIKNLQNQYSQLILDGKAPATDYRKYIDHGYFLAHFSELCVPTLTEKAMTTDPQIPIRKAELLELHKDELSDPKVVAAIEEELINMDKAWIKGDPAEGFYGASKKSYNVQRKKMHIMVGGVEDFNPDGGTITISHSLSEGINAKAFAAVANEIRKGHYDRGKETAKGGEMTKFIFRAFQDIKITEDDCKTKRGIPVVFGDILNIEDFISRMILVGPDKREVEITRENMKSYIGKTVILRSPMTCASELGLCYHCSGLNFKKLNIANPGVRAIEISSKFMYASMLSMHGTAIQTNQINPEEFIV
jgi:hypothetical protein